MLSFDIGRDILDGLFGLYGTTIEFSGDVYLGLLTVLDDTTGSYQEPAGTYLRVRIDTESRINKKNFIQAAQTETVSDGSISAYVSNQGLIMFPEAPAGGWGTIVGFGLFRQKTGGKPFLCGSIEPAVTINEYEVPIIRKDGFKISLA